MKDIKALRSKRNELLALKADLDRQIKSITNDILNHPELGIDVETLSNKGGSATADGFAVAYSRSIEWDQEYLRDIKDKVPANAWPFDTKETLGLQAFQNYCMDYPQYAELFQKGAVTKISKSPRIVERGETK
tara:strand:+ start:932 stop:1330 length:399 start_codon:yes stop_codon:yes gene_type:complete